MGHGGDWDDQSDLEYGCAEHEMPCPAAGGLPSHCASLRHGNCLRFELITPAEHAEHARLFGEYAESVCA